MKHNTIEIFIALAILLCISHSAKSQACSSSCNGANTFLGYDAGISNTGYWNSFFGLWAGTSNTTGEANSFFGANAGLKNIDGDFNSIFGASAGENNTEGIDNSFFGASAGRGNMTGNRNSFFGTGAGRFNTTGNRNSFFGRSAGYSNTTGSHNVCIGDSTGYYNTTSSHNTFVGSNSGQETNGGEHNSYFGGFSGHKNTTGKQNTFIGHLCGFANEQGQQNTFLGEHAGFKNVNGSNNAYVGYRAGHNLTNASSANVVLGSNAGPSSTLTVNNKLYIDNKETDLPLIYGDFNTDHVIINGTFEATSHTPSSRSLKHMYTKLDASAVLAKIAMMDIQEWSYIARPNQRHIGPIAEDFHEAFGLGRDDKSIATVDASGVALVAIQALQQENMELKELIKQLSERVGELENKE